MKNPMRILHVFGGLDRGGAETMVMNLYRNIDRSKIQFDFVIHYPEKDSYIEEIKSLGGKVHKISRYKGINHYQYIKEWHALFKAYPEYTIIHGHVRSTASIYLKIAKSYGRTTISHSHSTSNGTGLSSFYKKILQTPIKYIADYFFAPSIEAGAWLFGEEIIKNHNFIEIRNSIETDKYIYNEDFRLKKREELNISNITVIGHVGRFINVKNHSYLIEVFKQYQKINTNSILLLIGVGNLKNEIQEVVTKYRLEKQVYFLGSRSDVHELMQIMDIFIMPSFFEGLPLTLIEAQASGLPILASNMITKEVAVTDLVTFKDINDKPIEWAKIIDDKLLKLRSNKYDEIVKAGYDVKKTVKSLQDLYISMHHKQKTG